MRETGVLPTMAVKIAVFCLLACDAICCGRKVPLQYPASNACARARRFMTSEHAGNRNVQRKLNSKKKKTDNLFAVYIV